MGAFSDRDIFQKLFATVVAVILEDLGILAKADLGILEVVAAAVAAAAGD